ncbi:MAG: hypothetical protein K0R75_187 [Paenibacillaceae bacterium]|nr:hypothetical protein [Paenibacillaceae bacterium]
MFTSVPLAVLFDFDGTLQDSERVATEANKAGFRAALGREATQEELDSLVGKPMAQVIGRLYPGYGEQILAHAIDYYRNHYDALRCYDGVEAMLAGLAAVGIPLGIVSSKHRLYVEKELAMHGLRGYFPVIVGQEDTSSHKPSPEPLLLAAAQLGVAPGDCVYVGDQPTDMQAAEAAKMFGVAALWGEGTLERLGVCSPELICETPQALLEHLLQRVHGHDRGRVLAAAERWVEGVLGGDRTGHDVWHIRRVVRMAERLARAEGADAFVCAMAAWLHDAADEKLNASKEAGLRKVGDWLGTQPVAEEGRRHIMDIIATMSYNGGNNPPMPTLEGRVVQDADRLDAIGAIAIARTFVYAGWKGDPMHDPALPPRDAMTPEEYRQGRSTAINHFHEKLLKLKDLINTDAARPIAEERHAYMVEYLRQFRLEWDGD